MRCQTQWLPELVSSVFYQEGQKMRVLTNCALQSPPLPVNSACLTHMKKKTFCEWSEQTGIIITSMLGKKRCCQKGSWHPVSWRLLEKQSSFFLKLHHKRHDFHKVKYPRDIIVLVWTGEGSVGDGCHLRVIDEDFFHQPNWMLSVVSLQGSFLFKQFST